MVLFFKDNVANTVKTLYMFEVWLSIYAITEGTQRIL